MIDKKFWDDNGYLVLRDVLSLSELEYLRGMIDLFLFGDLKEKCLRSDLSGETDQIGKEKITQIMCPSRIKTNLRTSSVYDKFLRLSKDLLGEDSELDFDMLINKMPGTKKETPWHQDAAYWPKLDDRRACSFWIALDNVSVSNGCMMYVAGTHKADLRDHVMTNEKGALKTTLRDTDQVTYGEIAEGSAIVHHGFTVHGALGNNSSIQRRAWILNYRPQSMIDVMRANNFDHTGQRQNNVDE